MKQSLPHLPPTQAERLFDQLSNVVFFVKDRAGRYAQANDTLVERCGLLSKSELIGKRPSQVLGDKLGGSYEMQDQQVLQGAQRVKDQLELHIYPNRTVGWCVTNKFALHDDQGKIIGLAGVSQDLPTPNMASADVTSLAAAIDHARYHLADTPQISDLCARSGLSPYQLDRRIRSIFGLSAGQWLMQQRIEHARQLLARDHAPIAQIAVESGYSDQSAFTRQFRRATGLTPTQYRRSAGKSGTAGR